MTGTIPIGETRSIRECGFDESWLQDRIWDNPSCLAPSLRLREVVGVMKERPQSGGGRLDLLLKNPEDDTMYEVEVMLGPTNPDHIIRTIEYWDRERRKWPKRQHIAVLVAESITARFFNVIHLVSWAIPIIAVQTNILEANGQRSLHFTRVLDTYEEPEEPSDAGGATSEADWRAKAPWTLEAATALLAVVRSVDADYSLNPRQNEICLRLGRYNHYVFGKRVNDKSSLEFWLSDELFEKAQRLLDENELPFQRKEDRVKLTVDKATIVSHAEMFREVAAFVQKYQEG